MEYYRREDMSPALELIPSLEKWVNEQRNVFNSYLITWICFNAIYVAEYPRPYAKYKFKEDGSKEFINRYEYGLFMVDIDRGGATDRNMVLNALDKLPRKIKQQLITMMSPNSKTTCMEFFANRVPAWQGEFIHQDERGQIVNGVINVRETISRNTPRWAPVDSASLKTFLERFLNGEDIDPPDRLIRQMGDILYTVRNNLFHGCKGTEDSVDSDVLENAYKMLRYIVDFYLNWDSR